MIDFTLAVKNTPQGWFGNLSELPKERCDIEPEGTFLSAFQVNGYYVIRTSVLVGLHLYAYRVVDIAFPALTLYVVILF